MEHVFDPNFEPTFATTLCVSELREEQEGDSPWPPHARIFNCKTHCGGGDGKHRVVELTVDVEQDHYDATSINLTAETPTGDEVVGERGVGAGCSLRLRPGATAVEDVRLYVAPAMRNKGYGHLLLKLIKALFFPFLHVASLDEGETPVPCLPLMGTGQITRLTVLPSKIATAFYLKQGFKRVRHENKMSFDLYTE